MFSLSPSALLFSSLLSAQWSRQRHAVKRKPTCLCYCCSVTNSCLTLCDPVDLQHARLLCPTLSPGVYSNSCLLSWWFYLAISTSAAPFSFCLQSFAASGSYPMSQLWPTGDQSLGASASASVLLMNIQDWFPLGLTDLISLLSRGLSRVFSSTTIRKHQFVGAQPFLWSNSHIRTLLLVKPYLWL